MRKQADLTPEVRAYLKLQSAELTTYSLELDYDYWTAGKCVLWVVHTRLTFLHLDEILQAILPEELCDGSPTGFSITGHLGQLSAH